MNTTKANKTIKKFRKRIGKELQSNLESKEFNFVSKNKTHWYFQFTIQEGLYKGQKHIVETKLKYGQDPELYVYPMSAPMCKFITSIWHPNISDKGTICLDILKENWSMTMFTSTIISALKVLLLNPEPSSPQNTTAATMLKKSPEKYKKYLSEFYDYSSVPEDIRQLFN